MLITYRCHFGTKFVFWSSKSKKQTVIKSTKLSLLLFLGLSSFTFSQVEELTPEEQAYRDSITALNIENAAIANSQEAYNNGIKLFSDKKFEASIEQFKKSVGFDPNFTAAYYNKGVAENEIGKYADASKTLDKLIELKPAYSKAYFLYVKSHNF